MPEARRLPNLCALVRDVRSALGLHQVEMVLLAVRARALRDAFARFGRHLPTCLVYEIAPGACDCGFAQARRELLGAARAP
jgi:hypothetical protein